MEQAGLAYAGVVELMGGQRQVTHRAKVAQCILSTSMGCKHFRPGCQLQGLNDFELLSTGM